MHYFSMNKWQREPMIKQLTREATLRRSLRHEIALVNIVIGGAKRVQHNKWLLRS